MSFFNANVAEFSLAELGIEAVGVVTGFKNLDVKTKQRLLELGFIYGAKVSIDKKSFLGDSLLINLSGYLIAIRRDVAQKILVAN